MLIIPFSEYVYEGRLFQLNLPSLAEKFGIDRNGLAAAFSMFRRQLLKVQSSCNQINFDFHVITDEIRNALFPVNAKISAVKSETR